MAQKPVPKGLTTFTRHWLDKLGLGDKKCLLVCEDEKPEPFSGSLALFKADGQPLQLETISKPLKPTDEYVRQVRAKNFDLIVIGIAGWALERSAASKPCRTCGLSTDASAQAYASQHTSLQHTVLHELVHVAFPERSCDNAWTDRKVAELVS